jgi:drug/metabolite transporter (DMT)-like permease
MLDWLWAVFTVLAAAAQTARNATQHELTARLGTVGATHVRFLFGLPFALLFLIGVAAASGGALPKMTALFWPWVGMGAVAQILATALMLAAMNDRSFVVTIAYTKTEPVQAAIFGLALLGDPLTLPLALAILIASGGVFLMSWKRGPQAGGARPVLLGIGSGGLFGLAAVGFRGAILSLEAQSFVLAATYSLAVSLLIQTLLLSLYLALRERRVLAAILRAWRPSLFAGFMGATASAFWFLGFALTTAANVRTLGLVEVLFAQGVSALLFRQPVSAREGMGIAGVVIGVGLLLWSAA